MEQFSLKYKNNSIIEQKLSTKELVQAVLLEAEKVKVEEYDRNNEGKLLVRPGGNISNLGQQNELWWKIVRTPAFIEFFGDWRKGEGSKIIDRNGEPLAMFRNVKSEQEINLDQIYDKATYYTGKNNMKELQNYGEGVYFTPRPMYANNFGDTVLPVFLNVRNPKNTFFNKQIDRADLEASGHDGIFGISGNKNWLAFLQSKHPEDLLEIKIIDPSQMLLLPNPYERVTSFVSKEL